jgi:hypothetical protein
MRRQWALIPESIQRIIEHPSARSMRGEFSLGPVMALLPSTTGSKAAS